eukprot:m.3725 g.3725  ORF g.3725 m.3725 type:complete len:519 (-) comp2819_c0_seq1:256-1812(-)
MQVNNGEMSVNTDDVAMLSFQGKHPDDENVEEAPPRSKVGFWGLTAVSFFWVCGGIDGSEPLMSTGPPGLVFLIMLVGPVIIGVPSALVSLELSCAMPADGGSVVWVEEALGSSFGAHNTYWLWFSYVLDGAIYPVLAGAAISKYWNIFSLSGEYSVDSLSSTNAGVSIMATIIIGFLLVMQLLGTDVLVKFSMTLAVLSLLPVMIFMTWGMKYFDFQKVISIQKVSSSGDSGVDWVLLYSYMIWVNMGYIAIGSMSEEVENPRKTLVRSVFTLVPIVMLLTFLPLAIAISMDNDSSNFVPGHFNDLAKELAGEWLMWAFFVGAMLNWLGLSNSALMCSERMSYFFLKERFPQYFDKVRNPSRLYRWLWLDESKGVPRGMIFINFGVALLAAWIPLEGLVEITIMLSVPSFILMFVAFVYFKIKRPQMARPYKISGGVFGAVSLSFLPCLCLTAYLILCCKDPTAYYGIPYFKLIGFFGSIFLGVVVHAAHYMFSKKSKYNFQSFNDEDENTVFLELQ